MNRKSRTLRDKCGQKFLMWMPLPKDVSKKLLSPVESCSSKCFSLENTSK